MIVRGKKIILNFDDYYDLMIRMTTTMTMLLMMMMTMLLLMMMMTMLLLMMISTTAGMFVVCYLYFSNYEHYISI